MEHIVSIALSRAVHTQEEEKELELFNSVTH